VLDIWQPKSRRSNIQIMAEMLRVSNFGETGKAELSSTVNISYSQMQRYLRRLMHLGLVSASIKENRQVNYRITEKGKKLLTNIEGVQALLHRTSAADVLNIHEGNTTTPHIRPCE
jgi:predicted transcriptional regulator